LSTQSSFNESANEILLIRNVREEFKIKVFIKSKKKIKRVITTTTNDIINRTRETNTKTTLLIRKNIIIVKR